MWFFDSRQLQAHGILTSLDASLQIAGPPGKIMMMDGSLSQYMVCVPSAIVVHGRSLFMADRCSWPIRGGLMQKILQVNL